MSPSTANSLGGRQTSADFCTVSALLILIQRRQWIWLRYYRRTAKAKSREWTARRRRRIISLYRHHVHFTVLSYVCPFPTRYSSISAVLNKPIQDFSLSLIGAFPLAAHPAASPATLMVFSHINQLIKSKFQWWINLPGLMRCSASCWYQSTCCQMIVSCWDVWHYEVHLEAQLSYNGTNRSKSIFGIGRLFVISALLGKEQFIPPCVSYACCALL